MGAQLGVSLNQIVRTSVYLLEDGGKDFAETVLVVFLSDQAVDERKLRAQFPGQSIRLAEPGEALEATGYPKEFVPPLSVYGAVTLLDEHVLRAREIVCFAGNSGKSIRLNPAEIRRFGENVIVGDYGKD